MASAPRHSRPSGLALAGIHPVATVLSSRRVRDERRTSFSPGTSIGVKLNATSRSVPKRSMISAASVACGLALIGVVSVTDAGADAAERAIIDVRGDAPRTLWFRESFEIDAKTTIDGEQRDLRLERINLLKCGIAPGKAPGAAEVRIDVLRSWASGKAPTFLVISADSNDSKQRKGEPDIDYRARLTATVLAGEHYRFEVGSGREVVAVEGFSAARKRVTGRFRPVAGVLGLCVSSDDEEERARLQSLLGARGRSTLALGDKWETHASAFMNLAVVFAESIEVKSRAGSEWTVSSRGSWSDEWGVRGAPTGWTRKSISRMGTFTIESTDGMPRDSEYNETYEWESGGADCSTTAQKSHHVWRWRRLSEREADALLKSDMAAVGTK